MNPANYKLVIEDCASEDAISVILEGLHQHAEARGFPHRSLPLTVYLRDQTDEIVGGLHGDMLYGWLYVSLFWVAEALRGQGAGRYLIESAETAALERGCKHAYLNTYSFQALGFYQALGYEIFGELDDFPEGQKRYFLRKTNLKNYHAQKSDQTFRAL
jgi:GNAT superfamily N-acetyltransferase